MPLTKAERDACRHATYTQNRGYGSVTEGYHPLGAVILSRGTGFYTWHDYYYPLDSTVAAQVAEDVLAWLGWEPNRESMLKLAHALAAYGTTIFPPEPEEPYL